ncbi:MAG: GPW/gp25 family protein [Bacteroidota bacterium]|nr:GPW/gp25 family protein [Bacteroidota bacterium]
METNNSFLGTGWSFPPSFTKVGGDVVMTSDLEDILSSLNILLSTSIGERLMQPTYGCNLSRLQFEPVNSSLLAYIKGIVTDAILYDEPRIEAKKINIDTSGYTEGILRIQIDFIIPATNSRHNYVYPYYITEGNGIIP